MRTKKNRSGNKMKQSQQHAGASSGIEGHGPLGGDAIPNIATATTMEGGEVLLAVDPVRVRFQHSKIRPYFSGCGRSVMETLDEIRMGRMKPSDLPPIQVLVGQPIIERSSPSRNVISTKKMNSSKGDQTKKESGNDGGNDDGQWYFSLNNRRLWVLKRCREEGLLEPYGNKIWVRVRPPRSQLERERYTVENCALEAKLLVEKAPTTSTSTLSGSHRKRDKPTKNATDWNNPTGQTPNYNHCDLLRVEHLHSGAAILSRRENNSVSESHSDHDYDESDECFTTSNAFSALF
jgi:hypothetical protein